MMRARRRCRAPICVSSGRSTLDVLRAHRCALLFGSRREALTLAGVLALAGIRRALAGTLALAGVAGHALACGGSRARSGRDDRAGEEQGRRGSRERRTGFGIQLHDDLLDDYLTTRCDAVSIR